MLKTKFQLLLLVVSVERASPWSGLNGPRCLPVSSHFTDGKTEAKRKIGYLMSTKTRPISGEGFPTPGCL